MGFDASFSESMLRTLIDSMDLSGIASEAAEKQRRTLREQEQRRAEEEEQRLVARVYGS